MGDKKAHSRLETRGGRATAARIKSVDGPMISLRNFIEIMLGMQAAVAGESPRERFEGYSMMARAVEESYGSRGAAGALDEAPLESILVLAHHLIIQIPADDHEVSGAFQPEPDTKPELYTREQLMLPVHRTSRLLGIPAAELLEMPMHKYRRTERMAEALWAGFREDLLEALIYPHVTRNSREKIRAGFFEVMAKIRHKDGSPWRDHFALARERMGIQKGEKDGKHT